MKKIKDKITDVYNRYLIFIRNAITKKIKKFGIISLNIFFYLIKLSFLSSKKVEISIFSRYLILVILVLFSYLFYLSIPTLYNYSEIQKDLTKKLSSEFNLNTSLSANITYKILPLPNFELSNVLLTTGSKNKFDEYAQIKKMNIYISTKNLHNKNKITIKNILISEANIKINNNSYNYINNYLKQKISNKKIKMKKSKIFFIQNNLEKDLITLATIKNLNLFHESKKSLNKIKIDGTIYNTRYNFVLTKNINEVDVTDIQIKFKDFNALLKNVISKDKNDQKKYLGKTSLIFSGSELNTEYQFLNQIINLQSQKSKLNNKSINYEGKISISPFYYNIKVNLYSLDILKLFNNLSKIKNLLDEKILLNNKINGQILLNINSLKGTKFFDKGKIKINIVKGKLIINNTELISDKIGKIIFKDSSIEIKDNRRIFKANIFFDVLDQKKFYQKLQVPKSNKIKLNNIYLEMEKDLDQGDIKINEFVLNKEISKALLEKSIDLTNEIDVSEIQKLKNWIELKKFSNRLFSKIKELN